MKPILRSVSHHLDRLGELFKWEKVGILLENFLSEKLVANLAVVG